MSQGDHNGNSHILNVSTNGNVNINGAIQLSGIPSAVSTSGNGVIYYSSTQNKFLKSENGGPAMPLADPLVLQPPIIFTLDDKFGHETVASVSGSGIIHSIMFRIGKKDSSGFKLIIDGETIISVIISVAKDNYVLFLTPNLSWCNTESYATSVINNPCVNANLGFGFKSSFSITADGSTTICGAVKVVYSLYK